MISLSVTYFNRASVVNSRWLLTLYAVIPFCFIFVLLDALLWGHQWRDRILPNDPAQLILWSIVFNFPHIVSSMVTMADREYWQFYRKRVINALAVIISAITVINFVVPLTLPAVLAENIYLLFFVFFSAYTVWHVLSQQYGIGMMLMRTTPSRNYQLWRWCSTIAATTLYFMVFGKYFLRSASLFDIAVEQWLQGLALVFVLLSTILGLAIVKGSQRRLGTFYCLGNLAILPGAFCLLLLGYDMFVIVVPRFLHDLTAFMIYSVHDQNRNLEEKKNWVYRTLGFIPIAPLLLCPILAVVLANSIECGSLLLDSLLGVVNSVPDKCVLDPFAPLESTSNLNLRTGLWVQISMAIGFLHYYIEGFVWKRDSLHRHSVAFS